VALQLSITDSGRKRQKRKGEERLLKRWKCGRLEEKAREI